MNNPLRKINGGVPSYCCANEIVIEAIFEHSRNSKIPVLIEGTANQINQFGGYTGLTPEKFRDYIFSIADKFKFPREKIIIGGDHMGPLVWSHLNSKEAMSNASELVKLCVLAGFKKIHLDTSMKLADDNPNEKLSDDIIAERGAILFQACENAYQDLLKQNPHEIRPVYIIGSEVPIPGGVQNQNDELQITTAQEFENTINAYKTQFKNYGLENRFDDVIGVVVQPGVEFGDKNIHAYERDKAKNLTAVLKNYPNLVFEGHSTDYQTPENLKLMVEDGVKILKVGPALTFALREGLFALSMIENELLKNNSEKANFIDTLENEMLRHPKHWENYYHGSEYEKKLARKYSYSDRSRYYLNLPEVKNSINKLFANIDKSFERLIPGLLKQFMPVQYEKLRAGILKHDARSLVYDYVARVVDVYNSAVKI